jgi:putative transposase
VIFTWVDAEKAVLPVRVLCPTLGVSVSGFYAWRHRRPSARSCQDLLRTLHAASRGVYGSPRLQHALRHAGHRIGRKRVMRLMRLEQLRGRCRRRFRVTTAADPAARPAANHLARRFRSDAPNRVWAADITAVATQEGWLYLAVLLDLWSRRVVGWALRPTLDGVSSGRRSTRRRAGQPASL